MLEEETYWFFWTTDDDGGRFYVLVLAEDELEARIRIPQSIGCEWTLDETATRCHKERYQVIIL